MSTRWPSVMALFGNAKCFTPGVGFQCRHYVYNTTQNTLDIFYASCYIKHQNTLQSMSCRHDLQKHNDDKTSLSKHSWKLFSSKQLILKIQRLIIIVIPNFLDITSNCFQCWHYLRLQNTVLVNILQEIVKCTRIKLKSLNVCHFVYRIYFSVQ